MLLDNYYAFKKADFTRGASTPMKPSLFTTDGAETFNAEWYIRFCQSSSMYAHDLGYWMKNGKCTTFPVSDGAVDTDMGGVYFGSGSTPAYKGDYTLEAPIESGLTVYNQSTHFAFVEDEAGNVKAFTHYTLENTSDAEINVYEVGIVMPLMSEYSTSKWYPVLMTRDVFSSPVTIAPGALKMITLSIDLNFTLNVESTAE